MQRHLAEGSAALEAVVEYVVANMKTDIKAVFAGSVPYLKLAGIVLGGWQMARAAVVAQQRLGEGSGDAARSTRPRSPRRASLPTTSCRRRQGLRATIIDGSAGVMALSEEQF